LVIGLPPTLARVWPAGAAAADVVAGLAVVAAGFLAVAVGLASGLFAVADVFLADAAFLAVVAVLAADVFLADVAFFVLVAVLADDVFLADVAFFVLVAVLADEAFLAGWGAGQAAPVPNRARATRSHRLPVSRGSLTGRGIVGLPSVAGRVTTNGAAPQPSKPFRIRRAPTVACSGAQAAEQPVGL
jgi:hypothetical protein